MLIAFNDSMGLLVLFTGINSDEEFIDGLFAGTSLMEGEGLVTTTDLTTTNCPIELPATETGTPVWVTLPAVATFDTNRRTGGDVVFIGNGDPPEVFGDRGETGDDVVELISSTNLLAADRTVMPPLPDGIVSNLNGTAFDGIAFVREVFVKSGDLEVEVLGELRLGLNVIKVTRLPLSSVEGFN
jgi:hypothetical protein